MEKKKNNCRPIRIRRVALRYYVTRGRDRIEFFSYLLITYLFFCFIYSEFAITISVARFILSVFHIITWKKNKMYFINIDSIFPRNIEYVTITIRSGCGGDRSQRLAEELQKKKKNAIRFVVRRVEVCVTVMK